MPLAGALTQGLPPAAPRNVRARDPQRSRMAERAGVASALAGKDFGIGDAMAPIQVEGDRVEPSVVMQDASAASAGDGAQPMSQLVEEGEALVKGIGSGRDGDAPRRPSRHP